MDHSGGAVGGRVSESGIDWNLEYELSAKGYSFEDTQDYIDLGGFNFDEPGLNEAFTTTASVDDDYHYEPRGRGRGQMNHFIPPRPPTMTTPVPRKLPPPLPRKMPISSASSTPLIRPPTLKAPTSMTKRSNSTPASSLAAAAVTAANKAPNSITHRSSSIKPTSSTTTPAAAVKCLTSLAPKKAETFPPEEIRQIKLTAATAAFDRQVNSNLAKGRDPQLHKVPTFKKKEPVLTLKEKRTAAVDTLPPEPIEGQADVIVIAFTLPSGKRVRRRFFRCDSLTVLKDFLWSIEEVPNKFEVVANYPKRVFTLDPTADMPIVPTFAETDIVSNEMLYVIPALGPLSP